MGCWCFSSQKRRCIINFASTIWFCCRHWKYGPFTGEYTSSEWWQHFISLITSHLTHLCQWKLCVCFPPAREVRYQGQLYYSILEAKRALMRSSKIQGRNRSTLNLDLFGPKRESRNTFWPWNYFYWKHRNLCFSLFSKSHKHFDASFFSIFY